MTLYKKAAVLAVRPPWALLKEKPYEYRTRALPSIPSGCYICLWCTTMRTNDENCCNFFWDMRRHKEHIRQQTQAIVAFIKLTPSSIESIPTDCRYNFSELFNCVYKIDEYVAIPAIKVDYVNLGLQFIGDAETLSLIDAAFTKYVVNREFVHSLGIPLTSAAATNRVPLRLIRKQFGISAVAPAQREEKDDGASSSVISGPPASRDSRSQRMIVGSIRASAASGASSESASPSRRMFVSPRRPDSSRNRNRKPNRTSIINDDDDDDDDASSSGAAATSAAASAESSEDDNSDDDESENERDTVSSTRLRSRKRTLSQLNDADDDDSDTSTRLSRMSRSALERYALKMSRKIQRLEEKKKWVMRNLSITHIDREQGI